MSGLLKIIFFCQPGHDPESRFQIKLSTRIKEVTLDSKSTLCFALNDKESYCFSRLTIFQAVGSRITAIAIFNKSPPMKG